MKKEILIKGMTCNHCKMRVENALKEMTGVESVEVILEEGRAVLEVQPSVVDQQLIEVIDDAGYDVTEIK